MNVWALSVIPLTIGLRRRGSNCWPTRSTFEDEPILEPVLEELLNAHPRDNGPRSPRKLTARRSSLGGRKASNPFDVPG
jgi:hypothetical protein